MNSLIPLPPRSNEIASPGRGAISRILGQVLRTNRRNALAVKQDWNDSENPWTRFLICLIIDTSASMRGIALEMLFVGLLNFKSFLCENPTVARSAEIAVVQVGDPLEVITNYICAEKYEPSELFAWGDTPLAGGILTAIQLTEERLRQIERRDLDAHKAVLLAITDAAATDRDRIPEAIEAIRRVELDKTMELLGVGINAEAAQALKPFCGIHNPIELKDLKFDALFRRVSQHIVRISVTGVGRDIEDGIIDADWHR